MAGIRADRLASLVLVTLLTGCLGSELPTDAAGGEDGAVEAPLDEGHGSDSTTADVQDAPDAAPGDATHEETSTDAAALDAEDAEASLPCSPTALPGLVLWWDWQSIQSTGGVLTEWTDRSGNGMAGHAMGAPAIATAALAGHDVVALNGTATQSLWASDDPLLQWSLDDFLVEEVVSWTNTTLGQSCSTGTEALLWAKQAAPFPYDGAVLLGNTPPNWTPQSVLYAQLTDPCQACVCTPGTSVQTAATGYNDGQFRVVGMRRSHPSGQATLEARVGGQATSAPVSAIDVSAAGRTVTVGGSLSGRLAAVVAVHLATIDDAEVGAIESCLGAMYGLPPGP